MGLTVCVSVRIGRLLGPDNNQGVYFWQKIVDLQRSASVGRVLWAWLAIIKLILR